MEVRVLGRVELLAADGRVVLLPARQLRLLAALTVRRGEVCSADSLVDALWDASLPAHGTKALQLYVSRLRKALPDARISTNGSAYALDLDDDALDSARFERLLAEARASATEGNDGLALSLLDRGLSLWRGGAYGELAYEEFARAEAERMEELRLLAVEEQIEAWLRLGHHAEHLPKLRALVRAQPLRERLHGQLMLALHRCGRQAEALDVYASFRSKLRDELGLDPTAELATLQRRILEHDPGLIVAVSTREAVRMLPSAPNRLLGRERELGELAELLGREDTRLLVLTGAGGSGKTRLALEVARECAGSFANGSALVELAPLRDPELVLATIARALGLREQSGDPLETLCATLRSRELLLVLDNAEHLREASTSYVRLLAGVPRLKLLVTSRAVLHVTGERVYPVEPLAEEAATTLFVQRAQEAEPRFRADAAIRAVIGRICERLDGLPLAIELAASRARTLTPVELLARLDPRLPLLTGGPRDLPARQQTLRATLEWSYELLPPAARRVFSRLSVFAGGFSLEAAQAICDADLHALETLRDHSLLQRVENGSESRFAMLETIREYAEDRLPRRSRDHTGNRHAAYFARNVIDAEADAERQADYSRWLAVEEANIRAALELLRERGEYDEEAALLVAVARGWNERGILHDEARSALETVLHRDLSRRRRADVVGVLADFILDETDTSRRVELATEAVALARSLDEPALLATSLIKLGGAQLWADDLPAAERSWAEVDEIGRRESESTWRAASLNNRGWTATLRGDYDTAVPLLDEAVRLSPVPCFSLHNLGLIALQQGQAKRALEYFARALRCAMPLGWAPTAIESVEGIAAAVGSHEIVSAAKLLGAAEAERVRLGSGYVREPFAEGVVDRTIEPLRAAADETFATAYEQGTTIPFEDAVELALTLGSRPLDAA